MVKYIQKKSSKTGQNTEYRRIYLQFTGMYVNFGDLTSAQQGVFSPIELIPTSLLNQEAFVIQSGFSSHRDQSQCEFQLTLTHYILLTVPCQQQINPLAAVQLSFDLKFQVFYQQEQNVLSKKIGIRLFYNQQRSFSFYSGNPGVVESWTTLLRKKLNQRGLDEMYKPLGKLGEGGFGKVYLVRRVTDGSEFAVKAFLKSKAFAGQKGKEALMNQLEIMRQLDNSSLLKLQEVFQSDNSIYLVLQLMKGGHLADRIQKRKGKFTAQEGRQIMTAVLQGLNYMHAARIAHRDIKPQNILFRQKESFIPVLADFGLATNVDILTYLFYRCGTPGFAPPEILGMKGQQNIDPKCDLFSLGAVFHLLLTGRPLFQGVGNQVLKNNMEMNINFSKELYKSIDPQALSLLKRMFEANPQQRISAAQALNHPYFEIKQTLDHNSKIVSPTLTAVSKQPDIPRLYSPRKY